MKGGLAAAITIVLMLASGEGLLLLVGGRRAAGGIAARLAAAFGLGVALIATWSLLLAIAGAHASSLLLAAPVLLYPAGRLRAGGSGAALRIAVPRIRPGAAAAAAYALVAVHVVYVFRHALLRPIHGWDAWRIWSFRAKVIAAEGGFPADFFAGDWAGFPGYPLGIPFVEAFIARAIGYWHEPMIKSIFPLFYVGVVALAAVLLRASAGRRAVPAGIAVIASMPLLVHHGTVAYMDLPLAFFLLAAATHLVLWEKEGREANLLIAAAHAGFLAQVKNEGLPLLLLVTAVYLWRARRAGTLRRTWPRWFAPLLFFSLPWLLFKYGAGVPESPYHLFAPPGPAALAGRLLDFIRLTLAGLFLNGSWGIAPFALLPLLVPGARGRAGTPALLFGGGLLLFGAAYCLTGSHDFLMNGTALGRNLLVLMPLGAAAGVASLFPEPSGGPRV
ncbi:MAG: phospholipid carrier-dependent glycosyltransferase [Candidatus Eisenbacteria bacterium]|nr:phospholipid carrier-dependent glycosyltransferase [Candidatus Eisenbacteria bacterium]